MPRAEVGSNKYIANKMKSKGLQRLRFYCEVCQKQCRDDNGFKCHLQSESHVRQMLAIGSNAKSVIENYNREFLRDFVQLLRTAHNTRPVHINHFYQEYISNKEHIHMNATKWPSLTEFAKHLGRESICKVEETDKGLHIAWIDNSPAALERREAVRRKEALERGDEEREQKLLAEQIRKAQEQAKDEEEDEVEKDKARELHREEGQKIAFSFGKKPLTPPRSDEESESKETKEKKDPESAMPAQVKKDAAPMKFSFGSTGVKNKPKNIFSSKKSNPLSSKTSSSATEPPKKMSKAEEIMQKDLERKRPVSNMGSGVGFSFNKKQKIGS